MLGLRNPFATLLQPFCNCFCISFLFTFEPKIEAE
jgi:hypothetical protein